MQTLTQDMGDCADHAKGNWAVLLICRYFNLVLGKAHSPVLNIVRWCAAFASLCRSIGVTPIILRAYYDFVTLHFGGDIIPG